MEHLDVLVVGAGLSGIGAGHYLQAECPWASYAIFEARDAIGGTWDLFRYPGVRSDSDMYTLGYSFRPWHDPKAIADGPAILAYITETAQAHGIDRHTDKQLHAAAVRLQKGPNRHIAGNVVGRGASRQDEKQRCKEHTMNAKHRSSLYLGT